MRWFIACELDQAARDALAVTVDALRGQLGVGERSVRWVPPEKWHVTLAFLGGLPPDTARAVRNLCAEPVPVAPFAFTLSGVGAFPSIERPRLMWVGVESGASALSTLRAVVADRLAGAGVASPASERFHPHVTVGRVARLARPARSALGGAVASLATVAGRTVVDHVTLFDSRVVNRRSVYEAVARAPLCLIPSSS